MPGQLQYESGLPKPKAGDKIYIVVDRVNSPTGLWEGVLTEVGEDYAATRQNRIVTCRCNAQIAKKLESDSHDADSPDHLGREPHVNYTCLTAELMVEEVMRRRRADRQEIIGLQRRLDIVQTTYNSALRAIVSPDGLSRLEELLAGFLAKITGR